MAGIFSTLSVARSALLAQSAAIRTVGQNIANAQTEGYTRQRVVFAASRPETLGSLSVGTGVDISRIERVMDQQLEESLRNAASSLSNMEARSRALGRIESALNELDEYGIGAALERFFTALNNLAARPEDHTLRTQTVAAADALAEAFHFADARMRELRAEIDEEVVTAAGEVERIAAEIAQLNGEIVLAENGGQDRGTANDLRDRRDLLLKELAGFVAVKAVETSTGAVNVAAEGDWLVFGQDPASLVLERSAEDGVTLTTMRLASDGKLFSPRGGSLGALLAARDDVVPGIAADLDTLAGAVIGGFNRIHSHSEGLVRLTYALGTVRAESPTAPLDRAGLPFAVTDGRFFFTVKNEATGHIDRYDIPVDLAGPDAPTSLFDLADAINGAVGSAAIRAEVTNDFRLRIVSDSPSLTFGFEEDTSGVLAALGMNTFFTGSRSVDMGVSDAVRDDVKAFAAGRGAGPADNSAVLEMLGLRDAPAIGGTTMEGWWQGRIGALGVELAQVKELAANQQTIYDHLVNQREALSGVNIDEEAINLMAYQRAFQGAARLLSVVDELVRTLLQAV